MVILITGASHTGKTCLSKQLIQQTGFPCLSMDHLKMGLIRSGQTTLTPLSPAKDLTAYLWSILREMIKTAIENKQDLILEGCYIPPNWQKDFDESYRKDIRYLCLVMSEDYLRQHFAQILAHANDAEQRLNDSGCTMETVLADNARYLQKCREFDLPYILIRNDYETDLQQEVAICLAD